MFSRQFRTGLLLTVVLLTTGCCCWRPFCWRRCGECGPSCGPCYESCGPSCNACGSSPVAAMPAMPTMPPPTIDPLVPIPAPRPVLPKEK